MLSARSVMKSASQYHVLGIRKNGSMRFTRNKKQESDSIVLS
jgi:hypothetical protein